MPMRPTSRLMTRRHARIQPWNAWLASLPHFAIRSTSASPQLASRSALPSGAPTLPSTGVLSVKTLQRAGRQLSDSHILPAPLPVSSNPNLRGLSLKSPACGYQLSFPPPPVKAAHPRPVSTHPNLPGLGLPVTRIGSNRDPSFPRTHGSRRRTLL
jgi:hypothetical protein